MPMVIVPDTLRDVINAKLDAAFELTPYAEKDRDALYRQLVHYFYEHGVIPEFSVVLTSTPAVPRADCD